MLEGRAADMQGRHPVSSPHIYSNKRGPSRSPSPYRPPPVPPISPTADTSEFEDLTVETECGVISVRIPLVSDETELDREIRIADAVDQWNEARLRDEACRMVTGDPPSMSSISKSSSILHSNPPPVADNARVTSNLQETNCMRCSRSE